MSEQTPQIYAAINAVMADIGAVGKDQKNPQQGYMYRGIDDLYNAVHPHLVKHGVFIAPEVIAREVVERTSRQGSTLFYVTLTVKHTFYAKDGSSVVATTVGEAMDSGDKASNKAMSAAMKYALIQVFSIPVAGAVDSETDDHDVAPKQQTQRQAPPPRQQAAPPQRQQPQAAQPEGNQPTIQACIESVETKEGQSANGKAWTRYTVATEDGQSYSTFDDDLGEQAQKLAGTGVLVTLELQRNGKYLNLVGIVEEEELKPQNGEPQNDPPQTDTGDKAGSVETTIESVDTRTVQAKDGRERTIYGLNTAAGRFGCLDDNLGSLAQKLAGTGTQVMIDYETDSRGKRVVNLTDDIPF